MATEKNSNGYEGLLPLCLRWLKPIFAKLSNKAVKLATMTKKLAKDDSRRVVHAFKVGLAISLVSLLYYFKALYDGFGTSTMWAIVTVIVVVEFSVGGTLGRGLNRVMATLLAGGLGFGAHYLASLGGDTGRPIILAFFVFLLASISTFTRFFPKIKARYDYGMLIFILTFCMVSLSGYRDDEIAKLALSRILTILIGCCFTLFVCIFVRPVWAGTDLHCLVANNIQSLALFFQGFGAEFFRLSQEEVSKDDMQKYRTILNSKSNEESLTNLARWEPRHGKFRYRHPWKQYLKIGSLNRECAYRLELLNGYLKTNQFQMPSQQIHGPFKEECMKICSESSRGLRELALALRKMVLPLTAKSHIEKAKVAAEDLKSHLEEWRFEEVNNAMEIVQVVSLASLLFDTICCIEKIVDSVQELASMAGFKAVEVQSSVAPEQQMDLQDQDQYSLQPSHGAAVLLAHHAITIDEQSPC
ncbi:aluminum-activated malate transporter 2-like [Cucumis melo var. makuwa]|uniref:Aluminum-activated malate transporter 2-like n=1 Tax=Cucumis melo var. makuwa TaxID=1194695 RepID=A0A5A7UR04_CUCMM|nr:aluminum-activated malate transporter 2-like [Cucumis melo var. makuwa]